MFWFITQLATEKAIISETATSTIKVFLYKRNMPVSLAPSTLRTPISSMCFCIANVAKPLFKQVVRLMFGYA
jgi:hypothetical protein